MEGFWTLQLNPPFGGAVAVLLNGYLFGGGSSYRFEGQYQLQDGKFTAQIDVSHFAGPQLPGVRSPFKLDLNGTARSTSGDSFNLMGTNQTTLKISGSMTKVRDLPPRT